VLFSQFSSNIRRIPHQERSMLGRRGSFGPGTRDHARRLYERVNVAARNMLPCTYDPYRSQEHDSSDKMASKSRNAGDIDIGQPSTWDLQLNEAPTAHIRAARLKRLCSRLCHPCISQSLFLEITQGSVSTSVCVLNDTASRS